MGWGGCGGVGGVGWVGWGGWGGVGGGAQWIEQDHMAVRLVGVGLVGGGGCRRGRGGGRPCVARNPY